MVGAQVDWRPKPGIRRDASASTTRSHDGPTMAATDREGPQGSPRNGSTRGRRRSLGYFIPQYPRQVRGLLEYELCSPHLVRESVFYKVNVSRLFQLVGHSMPKARNIYVILNNKVLFRTELALIS